MASPFSSVADFVAYWRDPTHYRYADVTGLTLTGEILPIRKYLHPSDPLSLRAEDIAWLNEAGGERARSLTISNSVRSESHAMAFWHDFYDDLPSHTLDYWKKWRLQNSCIRTRLKPQHSGMPPAFHNSGNGAPGTMIADFTLPKNQTPDWKNDYMLWDTPHYWLDPIEDSNGDPIMDTSDALNLSTVEQMFALIGGDDASVLVDGFTWYARGVEKYLRFNGQTGVWGDEDDIIGLYWIDWAMIYGSNHESQDWRESWSELRSAPSATIVTPAGQDVANVSCRPIFKWDDSALTTATDYAYKLEQYSCTNTGGVWVPQGYPLDGREITTPYVGPSTRPPGCSTVAGWTYFTFIEINFYTTIPYHLITP